MAAQRLREALLQLSSNNDVALSATALCELAGVSRNGLYRYHQDVLRDLYKAQRKRQRKASPSSATRRLHQLRADNHELRQQITKLAAVVDHYFAAWREADAVLQRSERELADLRKRMSSHVISIKS